MDQYMWSVIQSPQVTTRQGLSLSLSLHYYPVQVAEAEEVSIDAGANMRPVFIKTEAGTGAEAEEVRPISPGSVRLASLGAWEPVTGSKSPGLYAPPDMNSES